MTFANTGYKTKSWIVKHFGVEGAKVIDVVTPYGYGVTVWMTPEKHGPMFGVHKSAHGITARLGVFDTSAEAVNFLKLLIASSRMNDETVDQSN